MSTPKTLYEVVGVQKDATPAQLKKAYYKRSRDCHPDKFPGDESKTAEFQALKAAYEELADEEKREAYGRTGETGAASAFVHSDIQLPLRRACGPILRVHSVARLSWRRAGRGGASQAESEPR